MSVYFIRVGRYFKIGASEDPQDRLARLGSSSTRYTFPADISVSDPRELYKVIDGWKSEEQRVHLALDDFAVGLEWFLDEPPLRAFIDALPSRLPRRLNKVKRAGGWCADEYERVQLGRGEREMARHFGRRAS